MPQPAIEVGRSRYALLAEAMRQRIVSGDWAPGQAIPSEQALASEQQVALGTMRRALDLLADEGLLERQQGRGTFVRQGLAGAPMLRFFRFGAAAAGGRPPVPQSRILRRQRRPASAEAAQALGLGPGDPALKLQRLRSVEGRPALLEDIWLPLPRFEPLADSDPAGWGDLLYPLYARRCGVFVLRAVDSIGFGTLAAAQARALGLAAGHPCAQVERHAFDLAGRCVEWRITRGDAHAFHYTVTIT